MTRAPASLNQLDECLIRRHPFFPDQRRIRVNAKVLERIRKPVRPSFAVQYSSQLVACRRHRSLLIENDVGERTLPLSCVGILPLSPEHQFLFSALLNPYSSDHLTFISYNVAPQRTQPFGIPCLSLFVWWGRCGTMRATGAELPTGPETNISGFPWMLSSINC